VQLVAVAVLANQLLYRHSLSTGRVAVAGVADRTLFVLSEEQARVTEDRHRSVMGQLAD
jgi:hypothetical protein